MDKPDNSITIYGAEWCPPCHMMKDYLNGLKIPFEYINIDKDHEAGMAVAQKTGWSAIPIVRVGDEYLLGFERAKLDGALRAHHLMR